MSSRSPGRWCGSSCPTTPAISSYRPVHRVLDVEVLELSRHVPSELLVRLVETTAEGADDVADTAARTGAEKEEDR